MYDNIVSFKHFRMFSVNMKHFKYFYNIKEQNNHYITIKYIHINKTYLSLDTFIFH